MDGRLGVRALSVGALVASSQQSTLVSIPAVILEPLLLIDADDDNNDEDDDDDDTVAVVAEAIGKDADDTGVSLSFKCTSSSTSARFPFVKMP